jgi:hypothetical protein
MPVVVGVVMPTGVALLVEQVEVEVEQALLELVQVAL